MVATAAHRVFSATEDMIGAADGFTLVESLMSTLVMALVLASAVALSIQVQEAYSRQLDDALIEQEVRYALEWIASDLRSAASDPYNAIPLNQGISIDPNGGDDPDDSIRTLADVNPADGDIADAAEDVTIALDAAHRVITRRDHNATDPTEIAMTDAVVIDLRFICLDAEGEVTASPEQISFVRVEITAGSPGPSRHSTTLATRVRVRMR
jgi:Tfp pilus assembly protein PilW